MALAGGIGENDRILFSERQEALHWLPYLQIVVVPADEEGIVARVCRRKSAKHPISLDQGDLESDAADDSAVNDLR